MDNDVKEVAPQTQRKKIEFKQIPGISPINKFYEIKFINAHPSDFRRCLTCKKEINVPIQTLQVCINTEKAV